MAVAFDAGTYGGKTASGTSLSWSHTCSGSERLITVGVRINSTSETVTGVTYNSVALTEVTSVDQGPDEARNYVWQLVAPATGSNTVEVTTSGAVQIIAGSISFTGVDQSSPIGTVNTNIGTSAAPTVDVVTNRDNSIVFDCVGGDGDTFTDVGADQTVRWDATDSRYSRGSTEAAGAAPDTVTMSHTMSAGTADWDTIGVEVQAASEASTTTSTSSTSTSTTTSQTSTSSTSTTTTSNTSSSSSTSTTTSNTSSSSTTTSNTSSSSTSSSTSSTTTAPGFIIPELEIKTYRPVLEIDAIKIE